MSKVVTIAQRRSLLQKLKEKGNIKRHFTETFSTVFQQQMNALRQVDDEIRGYAGGFKDHIKNAKKALKDRRYLDVAHFMGSVNNELKLISTRLGKLTDLREEHVDDFYGEYEFADLDQDYFKNKEAGILDTLKPRKQHAADVLEKMYYNTLKERHAALELLIGEAERRINTVLNLIKHMGELRASGDISGYISSLKQISEIQKDFENKFKDTYQKHIKPMVDRLKSKREEYLESAKPQSPSEHPKGSIFHPEYEPPQEELAPVKKEEEDVELEFEDGEKVEENVPENMKWLFDEPNEEEATKVSSFINNNPELLMKYADLNNIDNLMKYSQLLENKGYYKDSLKLISIAEGLLDE